jgi:uncharacterized membrane protein
MKYGISELAPPSGMYPPNHQKHTWANDLNKNGTVAGYAHVSSSPDDLYQNAARWEGTVPELMPAPNTHSEALAINDSGNLAGAIGLAYPHAFLYSGGEVHELSDVLGPDWSWAEDLNNGGTVVGVVGGGRASERAFIYDSTGAQPLRIIDPFPGDEKTFGLAINEQGDVAGISVSPAGVGHLFVIHDGAVRDLGSLGPTAAAVSPSSPGHGAASYQQARSDYRHVSRTQRLAYGVSP